MANKEVAELTAAATLDGTELVHVVQSGNSRRSTVGALAIINPLTGKVTPVDADELRIADSAASFDAKKLTFANLWAWAQAKILTLFNASGSAPVYASRAWVNLNGTGTVAIRASGNVSSVTDNGPGDYTVNFTTAMQDANYSVKLSVLPDNSLKNTTDSRFSELYVLSASSVRILTGARTNVGTPTPLDFPTVCVDVTR